MSRLKFTLLIVVIVIIVVLVRVLVYVFNIFELLNLPSEVIDILIKYKLLDIILAIIIGTITIQFLAASVYTIFKPHDKSSYFVRNVIIVIGYIILAFIIGVLLGLSPESILASATFSGLIIGLALQPVLSNFFSGLIILTTGYLKPGQEVRLAGIPLSILSFPAYKFFSRDYVVPNIRGTVVEIGFMYTKIIDTDGNLLKISNNMLLNNTMVLEETEEERRIQVRYEFPVTCDPDLVLSELHSVFSKKLGDYTLLIEEQSDKQYYIVSLRTITPPKTSGRLYRSNILKEMIKIHKKLIIEKKCVE